MIELEDSNEVGAVLSLQIGTLHLVGIALLKKRLRVLRPLTMTSYSAVPSRILRAPSNSTVSTHPRSTTPAYVLI